MELGLSAYPVADSDDRGTVGLSDIQSIRSFKDGEAATVILMIVAMVMCIDVVSARVRRAAI